MSRNNYDYVWKRSRAAKAGRALRKTLHLSGMVDVEEVANFLGLTIVRMKLGNADELLGQGFVAVSDDLSSELHRWSASHGFGHHNLHNGNLIFDSSDPWMDVKTERQAEDYARGILVDEMELAGEFPVTTAEVAEYFGVPVELLHPQGWLI